VHVKEKEEEKEKTKEKTSPFEPPYIEDLHVGDVEGFDGEDGMAVLVSLLDTGDKFHLDTKRF
jgi:hypothetical protein